jgi:hypothetical protein
VCALRRLRKVYRLIKEDQTLDVAGGRGQALGQRVLTRGKHSASYRLRAEIPGKYHTISARAQAMNAPGLRANSDEPRLQVKD